MGRREVGKETENGKKKKMKRRGYEKGRHIGWHRGNKEKIVDGKVGI